MTVAEYIVSEMIKCGVTDAFGIPGGVILKLLAAMKKAEPVLTPHLTYHEQTAGFAALGYAQSSGRLGVAYSTRGPGITNMITCIAEAYQESLPVLFITAHGRRMENNVRFNDNQELEVVSCISKFTKFAANADTPHDAAKMLKKAINIAVSGRKGPVFLDFAASVFDNEISDVPEEHTVLEDNSSVSKAADNATKLLSSAKRPILLIGDGLRYYSKDKLKKIAETLKIPVLSSRGSQDLLGGSEYYFGYVGSHGVRYSNFILSKADLIIAVGNRMAFPLNSASFSPVINNAIIFRVDIDENELSRHIPNEYAFACDGGMFLELLMGKYHFEQGTEGWLDVCRCLKRELIDEDCNETVRRLSSFMSAQSAGKHYVCDVGNNEFLFSRAYEYIGSEDSICCSKSFGTLGSSIGRAIGVYYASGGEVICVCGDQGFQYNSQDLHYISQWKLPIRIVLLNNSRSGMIADHEKNVLGDMRIHIDEGSGYKTPDFAKVAQCYGIEYTSDQDTACMDNNEPLLYEIKSDECGILSPSLPKGNPCQDMFPLLDRNKYEYLDKL
ncbi:MAG: thiamine pyrophosphate-binding protein [Huintestinicola sp.]